MFASDIESGLLSSFDALVLPGGGHRAMRGQLDTLGFRGCRAVRDFVEDGGLYLGSCSGSYVAARTPASFNSSCPQQREMSLLPVEIWNASPPSSAELRSLGIGTVLAENVAPEHPVMAGVSQTFPITYYNGPLFRGGEVLARLSGRTAAFTPAENFLGPHEEVCLIDEAGAEGIPCAVAGPFGRGRVVLFGPHPEFGSSIGLDDPGSTVALLLNALEWQLGESPRLSHPIPESLATDGVSDKSVVADLTSLPRLVARLTELCQEIESLDDVFGWLESSGAMSMFGRAPSELWLSALREIPKYADEVLQAEDHLGGALASFIPPESWVVDWGFRGAVPLLDKAEVQLTKARMLWTERSPSKHRSDDPYADEFENPYQLVAGSYLAAVGSCASAALAARTSRSLARL